VSEEIILFPQRVEIVPIMHGSLAMTMTTARMTTTMKTIATAGTYRICLNEATSTMALLSTEYCLSPRFETRCFNMETGRKHICFDCGWYEHCSS
jgi:hypothetical protein